MNWLAHLHLAAPDPRARVGALLPDLVDRCVLDAVAPVFRPAIAEHHLIDSFTDSHAVFARSRARFSPGLRRFSGILVDVFYDHFLTLNWPEASHASAQELVAAFYQDMDDHAHELPASVNEQLGDIRAGDWLRNYGTMAGLHDTLLRLGRRLRRPVNLTAALDDLSAHYTAFDHDFREFYPELQNCVTAGRGETANNLGSSSPVLHHLPVA